MLEYMRQEGVTSVMTMATTGLDSAFDQILALYFCDLRDNSSHRLYHLVPDELVQKSEDVHGVHVDKIHKEGLPEDKFSEALNRLLYKAKVAVYNPSFMAGFLGKHIQEDCLMLYDLPEIYHRSLAAVAPPEEILDGAMWKPGKPRGKVSFASVLSLSGVKVPEDPTSEPGALKCRALASLYKSLEEVQR